MKTMKTIILGLCLTMIGMPFTYAQKNITQEEAMHTLDTTMYGSNNQVGKYVKLRGFKMYYETYGKGKPVLMIHGNSGSINNFVYQIPYFSKKYKVIAADNRAQGKSIDKRDSLSYKMMADDFSVFLDSLHLDSVNVVGWSDGGIIGLLLAIRHPDKVKKLAVTGANLRPDTTAVNPFVRQWALHYNDTLAKMKTTPKIKNMRKVVRLMSYGPHISLKKLHTIQCPVLVIAGDHDVIRPKHTLQIFNNIPKAYLWILPNSGHSTPVFYQDEFNQKIDHFFNTPYRKIEEMGRFR